MFKKNIEQLKKILENFDRFVYFSFPKITTYLNKDKEEKKKPQFLDVEWKNINTKTINYSHAAFASICGKISNLTVIDIDDFGVYEQLVNKYPYLKNTFKVESKNGVHLYFNYNKDIKTTTKAFTSYPNVDIRNDDSIIFIPPTKYKLLNGDIFEYKFIGGDIFDIPEDLLSEFKQFNNNIIVSKRTKNNKNSINNDIIDNNNINNDVKNTQLSNNFKKDLPLTNIVNDIKKMEIENLIFKLPQCYYDNYDHWIKIGFIIFNELGLNGYELFDKWSSQSKKYDFDEVKAKYYSFKHKSDGLTVATLYKLLSDERVLSDDYNIFVNFTTGDNADYFKKKYGQDFIFSNGVLYYINGVYFTPFYISNADFYIVLNHIKIIYNSFLFFLFYSLEHIFLVFHKHP